MYTPTMSEERKKQLIEETGHCEECLVIMPPSLLQADWMDFGDRYTQAWTEVVLCAHCIGRYRKLIEKIRELRR